MLNYNILFLIICINLNTVIADAKDQFVRPQKLTKAEFGEFKKAFDHSWRDFDLDLVEHEDGTTTKAVSYSSQLPVQVLSGKCLGSKIYVFNLADFNIIDKNGTSFNVGVGYTGSAGTRSLIFTIEKNRLFVLYDQNVIEVLGTVKTHRDVLGCPDIGIVLSGSNFKDSKNNYDYQKVKLVYNTNIKKYLYRP